MGNVFAGVESLPVEAFETAGFDGGEGGNVY